MEEHLLLPSEESFMTALKLYTEGAYSKSVAQITLSSALSSSIEKGAPITGFNAAGDQVVGKAYEDNAAGATTIIVQYKTSDSQKKYIGCQVGASTSPNTEGCFAAAGTLSIDGTDSDYTYDPMTNNIAKRTIAGFSTSAQKKMAQCENCPYPMYEKFYDYYGQ